MSTRKIIFVNTKGKRIVLPKKVEYFNFIPHEIFIVILSYMLSMPPTRTREARLCGVSKKFNTYTNNLRDSSLDLGQHLKMTDEQLKKLTWVTSISFDRKSIITDDGMSSLSNLTNLSLHLNKIITNKSISLLTKHFIFR